MTPHPAAAPAGLRPLPNTHADAPNGRLRWVMHAALLLLGLLMGLASWNAWRAELGRTADAELINLAGAQRMLSQRVALLVSQGLTGLSGLSAALARAQADALRIETLLGAHGAAGQAGLPPALLATLATWQASRERLWLQAHAVARALAAGGTAPPQAATLLALHAEAEATLAAAQGLVQQLQAQADAKTAAALQRLVTAALLGAALLLGLALGVVEPIARRVRRQQQLMAGQARQLSRLALVAQRTHNAVLITDAQRCIVWANEAFGQLCDRPLAEVLGQNPAALLPAQGADADTLGRMRLALQQGQGVRVAMPCSNHSGRQVWLDIDIQPLHDPQGALSGFIAVETDITEQVYQRQRLRALLDALPTGVVEQDASGTIVDANRAAQQVLGLRHDQLCGRSSLDPRWCSVRDDLSPYPPDQQAIARSLRDGASVRGDSMGVLTPEGDQRWLLVNSEPLRNPAGAVQGAVACFIDVTEQRAQRTLLQIALQAAAIGTWAWRLDNGTRQWSAVSCAMLGYSVDEFAPLLPTWRERIHADDRPMLEASLQAHIDNPAVAYRCDMRVRHRLGHWVWLQSYGNVVERDASGRAQRVVGVHIDISERKRHEQQLQANATRDALTGVCNRAALMPALQQAVATWRADGSRHFALMFLDFDRFKQVNDTLGHAAGDELLRQIAGRLQGAVRCCPGDSSATAQQGAATVARLGGDEFVVLLPDLAQPGDAAAVADRLLQVLAQPYTVRGQRLHSSASIGMVTSAQPVGEVDGLRPGADGLRLGADGPWPDADSLLRDADTAMYEAKRSGRGRWVLFEPRMQTQVAQRAGLEADLHEALGRDELFVVYQPMLALDGLASARGCAGVEALVRWRHPARGVVAPGQFINVAEEAGLIGALGQFVLRTACLQFMRWRLHLGERAPALLAVNLSVAQLRQAGLAEQVRAVLDECAMPAASLQLEVSESLVTQDPMAQRCLRDLKALGVRLALDDFGAGWSSLASLQQLPVDTVKIDRSFVVEAERSEYHRALIEATVRVAGTLRMATVAEGIETEAQSALVRALGCDLGQGFLYGRPLAAEALGAWLAERAPPRRGASAQPLQLVSSG